MARWSRAPSGPGASPTKCGTLPDGTASLDVRAPFSRCVLRKVTDALVVAGLPRMFASIEREVRRRHCRADLERACVVVFRASRPTARLTFDRSPFRTSRHADSGVHSRSGMRTDPRRIARIEGARFLDQQAVADIELTKHAARLPLSLRWNPQPSLPALRDGIPTSATWSGASRPGPCWSTRPCLVTEARRRRTRALTIRHIIGGGVVARRR
jgi:hypothetical protein